MFVAGVTGNFCFRNAGGFRRSRNGKKRFENGRTGTGADANPHAYADAQPDSGSVRFALAGYNAYADTGARARPGTKSDTFALADTC